MNVKEIIKAIIKPIISITILMIILHCIVSLYVSKKLYPRTMIVSEINTKSDTVILTDSVGFVWEFRGIEDWQVGDICSCIMDTNGTENIEDDIIRNTKYNGQIEDLGGI